MQKRRMLLPLQLSSDDRRALLALARRAVLEAVAYERIPALDPPSGALAQPSGAFVTLSVLQRLRGCVGRIERDTAIAEIVVQCAIGAALHDSRFAPMAKHEIQDLEISVSVLSELSPIAPDEIEIGRHGLLIRSGQRHGLLLPQVAAERHWSAERFLEETCQKAELDPNAWRDTSTQIFGFTAECFCESDFRRSYSSST